MERAHTVIGDSKEKRVEEFWRGYLATLPPDSPIRNESYGADMFGDTMKLADEISALIAAGAKTATCSALERFAEKVSLFRKALSNQRSAISKSKN